jgi:spermidine synthase
MEDNSAMRSVRSGLTRALLLALFVGSGAAALIYEIVWFQLLELVVGSSAVSLGVLLATFMGGMCLGSLMVAHVVAPNRHPLRVYALIELGIGAFGLLVLFGMPAIGGLYTTAVGHGAPSLLLRSLVAIVCLLPPTILMGATLPAVARWLGASADGVSWLGFLYGANIAGGVLGCLVAGFYLLRVFDTAVTTYVALGLNMAVAAASLALERGSRDVVAPEPGGESASEPPAAEIGAHSALAAIALSGLAALGAEVVWTRFLALMLGATVYTFSIILAVFLVGLGLGSSAGSALSRRVRPATALGWSQLAAAVSIAWTAYALARVLPVWQADAITYTNPWALFRFDLWQCVWAVLPATLFWGASFPLALVAAARPDADPARTVGAVYAANTVGAIAGAIGFSMFVVPTFGTQSAERTLVAISAMAAAVVLLPRVTSLARVATFAVVGLAAVGAAAVVPGLPPLVVAYGRSTPQDDSIQVLYVGEGMSSSVAVTELLDGTRNFHVSGKIEASTEPQDMHLQRMLGNLPALLHPDPKSVLVVGFGAGVTAGSFVPYPEVERLTVCEIEPLIIRGVAPLFAAENQHVLDDGRVHVTIDDARHFVRTTDETFDVITSDPIHPWVKGAATLYTREYFEIVKAHLNPGGIVSQWVPLYESSADVVKSEIATFFEVFPNGTIWANNNNGAGYDVVLLGQVSPLRIDVDAVNLRMRGPGREGVAAALGGVGIASAVDLLGTYAGRARELRPWLADAVINRDRNLRLQYLAGLRLNTYESDEIYKEMVAYRRFPDDLFAGSDQILMHLRSAIENQSWVPE